MGDSGADAAEQFVISTANLQPHNPAEAPLAVAHDEGGLVSSSTSFSNIVPDRPDKTCCAKRTKTGQKAGTHRRHVVSIFSKSDC